MQGSSQNKTLFALTTSAIPLGMLMAMIVVHVMGHDWMHLSEMPSSWHEQAHQMSRLLLIATFVVGAIATVWSHLSKANPGIKFILASSVVQIPALLAICILLFGFQWKETTYTTVLCTFWVVVQGLVSGLLRDKPSS